jgi:hypothetical protein
MNYIIVLRLKYTRYARDIQNIIENLGPYVEVPELSAWFVRSGFHSEDIFAKIHPYINEEHDHIFIGEIYGNNQDGWTASNAWSLLKGDW